MSYSLVAHEYRVDMPRIVSMFWCRDCTEGVADIYIARWHVALYHDVTWTWL